MKFVIEGTVTGAGNGTHGGCPWLSIAGMNKHPREDYDEDVLDRTDHADYLVRVLSVGFDFLPVTVRRKARVTVELLDE